jgi:3-isopropylmalate/(R)-2-methylmalate dehydratase large subunit
MGMTAVEKVLALKGGCATVRPGDVVEPNPDLIMIHDNVMLGAKQELDSIGIDRIAAPEKVIMVSDHEVLYGSLNAARMGAFNRAAAAQWRVTQFYDVGRAGHGHLFPMERGLVLPGMLYFDNDRHSTNAGAIGAFGLRMGAEISRVLATGTNWVIVPPSIRLDLIGTPGFGVYPRDIGFHLAKQFAPGGKFECELDYTAIEFSGAIDQFPLSARIALCSSPTEMGAYGTFFPPSAPILDYARQRAAHEFTPIYPDDDARYDACVSVDLAAIEPQVVRPGHVSRAIDVSEVVGTRVDHAFVGSCASGTWDDMVVTAEVLRGKRIAPHVRMFIAPGTEDTTKRVLREGLMEIFIEAGAVMLPAGCGPCNEGVVGPLDDGDVSISTATANLPGKFGNKDAKLYLGSPATVAASAIAGKIVDARSGNG